MHTALAKHNGTSDLEGLEGEPDLSCGGFSTRRAPFRTSTTCDQSTGFQNLTRCFCSFVDAGRILDIMHVLTRFYSRSRYFAR